MGKARIPVAHGYVTIEPDLPRDVEVQTRSGLWLPAQKRAERFKLTGKGERIAFAKGDLQVVSGTVVSASPAIRHAFNVPTATAMELGLEHIPYAHGISMAVVEYPGPVEGDKVWFAYGTWGQAESQGNVWMQGDRLMGRIPEGSIHLVGIGEEWRCPGPWVVCESIPVQLPDDETKLVGHGIAGLMPNARIARVCGNAPHLPVVSPGDLVFHVGTERTGRPVPFTDTEWSATHLNDIVSVIPGGAPSREELDHAWKKLWGHNAMVARYTPIKEGFDTEEEARAEWFKDDRERFADEMRKKYRSKANPNIVWR